MPDPTPPGHSSPAPNRSSSASRLGESTSKALHYAHAHREAFLDELKNFLRIPSISTLPKHRPDIRKAAQFVADRLTEVGLQRVKLIRAIEGHPPLVYGEWLQAADKPMVLIYGHYDVQPVDPINLWQSPPFEPVIRNGNIYARGAVDDKGQVLALIQTLDALMKANGTLPVNVKVLVEGEEECGGEAIEEYVKTHPKELACDAVLIADTGMPAPDVPALVYSLRGMLYTEIEAKGAERDLHSGQYGGVAPNPLHALALVLTGLKGANGHINIPGLYEKVQPVPESERALWKRNPVNSTESLKKEMGTSVLPGELEYSPEERLGARPTLEVHGIIGGFIGDGSKTVIPSEAKAKVSLRLPPGISPDEVLPLLQKRVAELCPPGVTMKVRPLHGGNGVLVPLENIYMRAAERALEEEWGRPPVFIREGGSIPIGEVFTRMLHAPVIFMGTGLPDDNVHAPNEKYSLSNYYHLIGQAIRFLEIVGNDPAVVARPSVAGKTSGGKTATTANSATPASAGDGASVKPSTVTSRSTRKTGSKA